MMKFLARAVLLGAVLGLATSVYAQNDITSPTDTITAVDLDGTVGSSPAAETVNHAIDNVRGKYLNFGEPAGTNSELNTGFIVTPAIGGTIVTGLRIYTANDAPERDPASYTLQGSASGAAGPWTLISSGALALPTGRNTTTAPNSATTPINSATDFLQTVLFTNTVQYSSYRLTFPTVRDVAAANSMQIAEVELLGVAIPEPTTILLAVSGLISVLIAVRRQRR